jgi:hypothetical protein
MKKLHGHQKLALSLMAYATIILVLVYQEVNPEIVVHIIVGTIALVLLVGGFYAMFGQSDKQRFLLAEIHACGDSVTAKELLAPHKEEFVRQFLFLCALWRLEDYGLVEQRKKHYTLTSKGLAKLEYLDVEASVR